MAAVFSIFGCYDDTRLWETIDGHESRIKDLETACAEMNRNLVSMKTIVEALNQQAHVTGVTPITENGKEIGYTVSFDKLSQITIYHGNNGKDGVTPIVGVRQDADNTYYWTVDGEWLLDKDGNKIPTSGIDGQDGVQGPTGPTGAAGATPQFKIEDGYWYMSYDGGTIWEQLGKAIGESGDSFFKSVTHDDKSVTFTLADGLVLTVPKVVSLVIDFDMDIPLIVQENSSLDINYSVTSVLPDVEVEALCSGDVVALVIPDEADCMRGVIRMEISDTLRYEYSKVVVLVSNGEKVIMKTIRFEDEQVTVSDEVMITVPAEGGVVELPYFANVDCDLFIPADAQTWIGPSVETKGYSERRYSVVVAQNSEHYRKAVVSLLSPYGKFALNYIIEQAGEKAVTEEVLEAELVKCWETQYSGMGSWQRDMYEYVMPASGLIGWKSSRTGENWTQCRTLTLYPGTTSNQRMYEFFYNAVSKCNGLIELLEESQAEESVKNEVEGEARFLRGWMYFSLVRFYGDVPLLLDSPQDINAVDSSRVSYMEVYRKVLEDLEFAEQNMRSSARQAAVAGDHLCRPHKWAATAMKAQVYTQIACLLENKDYQFFDLRKPGREPDFTFAGIVTAEDAWAKALQTAESVISCGEYQLEADYASLFDWGAGKPVYQSKERILVLQNGHAVLQNCNIDGFGLCMARRTLPPYWQGPGQNNNSGRVRPSRFPVVKWCRVHGGVRYTAEDLTGLFSSCYDPRYDISYIHTRYTDMSTGNVRDIYPSYRALSNGSLYMPFFRKYSDSEYDATPGKADMYMIRLAEMYLIAAEASASLSSGPGDSNWNKALEYMEVLHARARRSGDTHSVSPSMSNWTLETREDLVDAIMWERVFELHGEGCHEFFDTHRRGSKWMSEWLARPLNEFNLEPEQNTRSTYFRFFWGSTILPEDPEELCRVLIAPIPTGAANSDMYGDQMYNDFYL